MIQRTRFLEALHDGRQRSPVVALLGPRQCGKTTLAREFADSEPSHYLDLESISDQRRLEDPEYYLGELEGLVILDEIQLMPELFSVLRVLVDRQDRQRNFLILGSASPQVVKGVSESLAGRVEFLELGGFDIEEIGTPSMTRLWLRGGFPRSYLAADEEESVAWRESFVRTFLERDIPQLGIQIAAPAMRRFWTMLAHSHGQTWNSSDLSRSMGLSDKTVRGYLDLLTGTFMVRQLQPWFENIKKRQVKAPKIYLRDSGLVHRLLEIDTDHHLRGHPRVGASWEGFALEQALRILRPGEPYFWAAHGGAELDLLFSAGGRRYGLDFKFNSAPKITRSMLTAINDLQLEHLWIVCPVTESHQVQDRVTVTGLGGLQTVAEQIRSGQK